MADVVEEWKALLCGRHRLETVNTAVRHPKFGSDDPDDAVAIQMDGRIFLFVEDGEDGYRSRLGSVLSGAGHLYGGSHVGREVDVTYVTNGDDYGGATCSMFEFRDVETGKLALAIGTEDMEDYYPNFTCKYDPTAFGETT